MDTPNHRREKGQTLVVLALVMTVLMLMVGLAIDVGMAYNERRDLQNAADGAALAGTQMLCDDHFWGDAETAARTVGLANGATEVNLVDLSDSDSRGMRAVATGEAETFFFRIVGIPSVSVSASAAAKCACAGGLGGNWPLAFDLASWETQASCGDQLMVWAGQPNDQFYMDPSLGPLCYDPATGTGACDCDRYTDTVPQLPSGILDSVRIFGSSSLGPGQVGWANLGWPGQPVSPDVNLDPPYDTGKNCGNTALKTWLRYGYQGVIDIGDCVPGEPGIKAEDDPTSPIPGDALDIAAERIGDELSILLFDAGRSNTTECTNANKASGCNYTGNAGRYFIADFGCVRIEYVDKAMTLYNHPNRPNVDNDTRSPDHACEIKPRTGGGPANQAIFVNERPIILATKICPCPASTGWAGEGGSLGGSCVPSVSLVD